MRIGKQLASSENQRLRTREAVELLQHFESFRLAADQGEEQVERFISGLIPPDADFKTQASLRDWEQVPDKIIVTMRSPLFLDSHVGQ